jgi:hypothetical protein
MNLDEILLWLEGTTLEFKCELGSPEPFLKTIVAFSSTAGGTVMIDIEDRTRRVVGVGEPLALEARLANLISDTVRSRLAPDIEILPCERQILLPCRAILSQRWAAALSQGLLRWSRAHLSAYSTWHSPEVSRRITAGGFHHEDTNLYCSAP